MFILGVLFTLSLFVIGTLIFALHCVQRIAAVLKKYVVLTKGEEFAQELIDFSTKVITGKKKMEDVKNLVN